MSPRLVRSQVILDAAHHILDVERLLLRAHHIAGELVLVGGASVAGALTKGDVDLHLRVAADDFVAVVERVRYLHQVVHPEIWQPSLATFAVEAALPTGLAVTPIGSEHDLRFTRTWELLRSRPELIAQYNSMKLASDAPEEDAYEGRKSHFFDQILLHWPAG